MTPANMPKIKPQRVWTPPSDKRVIVTPVVATPRPDNARCRRSMRNGYVRNV